MVVHPLIAELLEGRRYDGAREVLLRCGARTGERLVSVSPSATQARVPDDARRPFFHEEAAGRRWRVSARSFFQSRPDGADALAGLVATAAGQIGPPSTAVDLYSGVGLFAGVLAQGGWEVTAVEGSASSAADAAANLAGLPVVVVHSDVARWAAQPAQFVVADPSRNGLGRDGAAAVVATGARRVVLVSCDPASLGRDAGLLCAAGYHLTSVTPVDLFPHTFHVEVVSVFDRA
jgi:23S rRNA (uracil1939-C5)-methyltransferase